MATDAERLGEGLAALKRGQYDRAIAVLEPLVKTLPETTADGIRARMALVTAYGKGDRAAAALNLCKTLANHSNGKVQRWVQDQLPHLERRVAAQRSRQSLEGSEDPEAGVGDAGFVPLDGPDNEPASQAVVQADSGFGDAGFVPLDGDEPSEAPEIIVPGPIAPPPSARPTKRSPNRPPIQTTPKTRNVPRAKGKPPEPQDPPSGEPRDRVEVALPAPVAAAMAAQAQEAIAAPDADTPDAPYEPQWTAPPPPKLPGRLPPDGLEHRLWQLLTLAAIAWSWRAALDFHLDGYNQLIGLIQSLLIWFPYSDLLDRLYFERYALDLAPWLLGAIAITLVTQPWLGDVLLQRFLGGKPLKFGDFIKQHPAAARLLQRQCRQLKMPVPHLRLIPTDAPLALTYGTLRRTARIALSTGVIAAINDDELAALCALQLARIQRYDAPILAGGTLLLLLPYGLHWRLAPLVERWSLAPSRLTAAIAANWTYGWFRILTLPLLWLTRRGQHLDDQRAAVFCGDPNAVARVLVKFAIATADHLHQRQHLGGPLEALALLQPLPPRAAVPFGSLWPHSPLEPVLAWGIVQPYRHWLTLNQSHPPLGDRLERLSTLAQRWRTDPQWDWSEGNRHALLRRQFHQGPTPRPSSLAPTLWLQSAPYLGAILGAIASTILWSVGGVGRVFAARATGWMYGDLSLTIGLAAIGAGLGLMVRINPFFPEMRALGGGTVGDRDAPLASTLVNPYALPINSQPLRLEGRLLGRKGFHNGWWQDLWLQTPTGTLPLHLTHRFGPLAIAWRQYRHPLNPSGQTVTVTGWIRRGATPWMDVDSLTIAPRRRSAIAPPSLTPPDAQPLWNTAIAIALCLYGIHLLYTGL
ncbi:MAG: M48 family metalloprotease [Cyanobacteria bacterium]|nr:M48 family metalloprotease [Cyanobacteriota bacterium]